MILIVVPCYNEEQRLHPDVFRSYLAENSETLFLFVDDGSTDRTLEKLQSIESGAGNRVFILTMPHNHGKAEAIRQGVLQGLRHPVEQLGFWDADLATPLPAIAGLTGVMAADPAVKMVCGARVQRLGAAIHRHWYRHYPGRIIATSISALLGLPVYDSQCGAKVFARDLAEQIFAESFLSRWLFDVELFARTIGLVGRHQAARIIYEYPLTHWTDIGTSKISPAYLPKIPFELWRIHRHYRQHLQRP
ncbi:MAG: glycosyltransferase [Desulfofustis sp.]|nr:glycosyltransferase [Desulfofustis sp.]